MSKEEKIIKQKIWKTERFFFAILSMKENPTNKLQ